jgi:putative membrane protein
MRKERHMLRFLAAVALRLLATAAGLAIAAGVLEGFSVTAAAFIGVVVLFTLIEVVLDPLVLKLSIQYAPVLRGGVALVTTLLGLIVVTLVSDGLKIEGLTAWVVGTLIVWLGGVLAALILPLFLFKKTMAERKN